MAKTIVITGASSGFGKGVARRLDGQGHNLVLAARREDVLGELAGTIGSAVAVPTDVTNQEDVERVFERAIAEFGQIDVWMNIAGVGAVGRFDEIPLADQIGTVETNLIGTVIGSHFALRHFVERGEGTLVNVGSVAGRLALPYFAVYGAVKGGIGLLSASVRRELELADRKDIHVCVVNPWASDTPFWEHSANYTGHELLMPMVDNPEDVIDAIVDLLENPKDEVDVSVQLNAAVVGSHVAPGLTEAAASRLIHTSLMEKAPEAGDTAGAVHTPMASGTGVEGDIRKRMEEVGTEGDE